MTARSTRPVVRAALVALVGTAAYAVPGAAAAAPAPAPRIVKAQLVDVDRDDRADALVLTYSRPVSHARDTSRFPVAVAGYRVTRVERAVRSRTLVVRLQERATTDVAARPRITYSPTRQQPVLGAKRIQAVRQTFAGTVPLDLDGDGHARLDCAPTVAGVHPDALDRPDLDFVDADCDGLDGDPDRSVFVDQLTGKDAGAGTMTDPVRTLQQGLALATTTRPDVLVAVNEYSTPAVDVPDGVGVFGGYGEGWARADARPTVATTGRWRIAGTSTLQLISVSSFGAGSTVVVTGNAALEGVSLIDRDDSSGGTNALLVAYGATAVVRRSSVAAGNAAGGGNGTHGINGLPGGAGSQGGAGQCDADGARIPGGGGASPHRAATPAARAATAAGPVVRSSTPATPVPAVAVRSSARCPAPAAPGAARAASPPPTAATGTAVSAATTAPTARSSPASSDRRATAPGRRAPAPPGVTVAVAAAEVVAAARTRSARSTAPATREAAVVPVARPAPAAPGDVAATPRSASTPSTPPSCSTTSRS